MPSKEAQSVRPCDTEPPEDACTGTPLERGPFYGDDAEEPPALTAPFPVTLGLGR